jgi:ABC-type amino acid transport substrate-binding protein
MRRHPASAAILLTVVLLALVAACRSSSSGASPPTGPISTTTSTTTAATADPGFRTRQQGVLTVAADRPVPPYFIQADGQIADGFEYDLARAIATSLQVTVRVVPFRLVSIVSGKDCGCDIFLSQTQATETLARTADLSEPYLSADQAVVVRAGAVIGGASTARALRWGTELSDSDAVSLVQRQLKPAAPLELFSSQDELLAALRASKIDAALLDAPSALIASRADASIAIAGRIATGGVYTAVLPLGSPNTSALNDIIRKLRDNGTLMQLSKTFFGAEPSDVPVLKLT